MISALIAHQAKWVYRTPAHGEVDHMTTDTESDAILALIESGKFDDTTDPAVLAAALAGNEPEQKDDTKTNDKADTPADEASQDAKADANGDSDEAGITDEEAAAGKDVDPSAPFKSHPIYGTLTSTRETLKQQREARARAEQETADLRRQLDEAQAKLAAGGGSKADVQAAADAAGMTDEDGNAIDVAKIDINKLREEYDGPIVDAIAALQGALAESQSVIRDLRGKAAKEEAAEVDLVQRSLQEDIDSVPVLSRWAADQNSAMFDAAAVVDKSLMNSPEWRDRPRVERFREVVRMLGGQADTQQSSAGAERAVAGAKSRAAARAAPTSLSELPSGTPAGQSELETLENLDVTQLAEKMAGMTQDQQERLLARLG